MPLVPSHRPGLVALGLALLLTGCGRDAATPPAATATPTAEAPVPVHEAPAAEPHAHEGHAHEALPGTAPLPGRSIYHLGDAWEDHRGARLRLAELRGAPAVVVLFYGTCDTACPVLVHDAERLAAALPPAVRDEVRFVLITIDPERDDADALARYADAHDLTGPAWSLLRGDAGATRAIATVLGVQYRKAGDGFSHSNVLTLLDRDGVVAGRIEGLAQPVEAAAATLAALAE